MKKKYRCFLILLLTVCFLHCDKEEKVSFVNKDQRLDLQKKILLDESNEQFLGKLYGLEVDYSKNIYCLDLTSVSIAVFDSNGTRVNTIGSFGKAPGELTNPLDFFVSDSLIAIFDASLMRVTLFSLAGELVSYFKLDLDESYPSGAYIAITNRGTILVSETATSAGLSRSEMYQKSWRFTEYSTDGKVLNRIGKFPELFYEKELFNIPPASKNHFNIKSDLLFTISTSILPTVDIYKGDSYVKSLDFSCEEFPIPGKLDNQTSMKILNGEIERKYIGQVSYLPNSEFIVAFHGIIPKGRAKGKRKYFLTAVNMSGRRVLPLTDISSSLVKPVMFCTDSYDNIYYLSDDSPDNITISKFRLVDAL